MPPKQVKTEAEVLDGSSLTEGQAVADSDAGNVDPNQQQQLPSGKVKVKVGKQELETDSATAAVLEGLLEQNQQLFTYLQNLQAPNHQLRPAVKSPDSAAGYDYENGLFTEPKVALQHLREEIEADIRTKLTLDYNQAESAKSFWAGFYDEHKELKSEKLLVDAILARDYAKLANLSAEDASEKLSASVKKELLRLNGGRSNSDPNFRGVEGGSHPGSKSSQTSGQTSNDGVGSLSDVIRARQKARREAMFHKE